GALANSVTIEDFVVTGASKRGWTTWLTAATDHRVAGIAPMVIDVLNLDDQMTWHKSALCGYAEAIHDYVDMGVIERLGTPEGDALQEIVDPYAYATRFNIPKLGLNGTADQFFLPDSAQFYYPEISNYGSMHLRYFPNGDHHLLEGYNATVRGMLPFYNAVVNNQSLPSLEWEITESTDEATVDVQLNRVPLSATLWTGTVGETSGIRDFRIDTVGEDVWQATELSPETSDGMYYYTATVPTPLNGWTGYFMSFEFESGIEGEPHVFTTEVRCVPSLTPCYEPGGYGTIETVGSGSDAVTVVRVGGNRFEMGYWYGNLLAEQIDAVWATFSALAASLYPPGTLENAVEQMWKEEYFDTAAWEEELSGIAQGCRMAGYPDLTVDILKKILAIPDVSEYNCSLFAAWGEATAGGEMFQQRNLDWSMDLGIQNFPVVAIYEPDDGIKHAVIGFAGLVGIAGGGMNEYGLAVSQIMGYFCDEEFLEGIPFPVLLRDVVYHDSTLTEALTRMEHATRTNQYHYCVGDPNAADPKARLLFTSRTRFDEWVDNESVTGQHPCHPEVNPFHDSLNDVVYWKNHNGRDNEIIYNALSSRYGTLDAQGAIDVAKASGVDGTLLSIIYHNSGDDFWVAYADGLDPAHKQEYVQIELNP
ncbi:MAG: C45 family autoproteolytic acyltransferase/hydrolase, partial [Candidatus Hydrogenedentes bacterium]|nr:C45 family autoproteolytic acyltransferase/hydrolase [Candidatus Hydrogenedentota bacterium]